MPKIVGSIPLVLWLSCPFLLRAWVFSICVRGFNASYEAGALLRKGSIPMEFLDTTVLFPYLYTDLYFMVIVIRPGLFSFLNTGCSVILVGWHGTFEGWKHLTRFRLIPFVRRRGFRFRVLWTNPTADALQAACERGIGGLRSRGEDENGKLKW